MPLTPSLTRPPALSPSEPADVGGPVLDDPIAVKIRERLARGLPPFGPPPPFDPLKRGSGPVARALDEARRRRELRYPGLTDDDILWMQGGERGAAVKPVERPTRKRRPTIASVVRQLQRAGVEVAGVEISDGAIKVLSGKPVGNIELDDASSDPRWH